MLCCKVLIGEWLLFCCACVPEIGGALVLGLNETLLAQRLAVLCCKVQSGERLLFCCTPEIGGALGCVRDWWCPGAGSIWKSSSMVADCCLLRDWWCSVARCRLLCYTCVSEIGGSLARVAQALSFQGLILSWQPMRCLPRDCPCFGARFSLPCVLTSVFVA